tara:strand:+ start:73 stop:660 length:588 start_codon:yes stop_codon:yes gene_type:complete
MKFFLSILLILFIQNSAKSGQINIFQLEGVSVGESLLSHYDLSNIKKKIINKVTFPKSDKFYRIAFKSKKNKYDYLAYYLKKDDQNFTVYSAEGLKYMNYSNCKKKMNSIKGNLENILSSDYEILNKEEPHTFDKDKKSIVKEIQFIDINDKHNISANITCTDWSKQFEKKGYYDSLALYLNSKEFSYFMFFEAY